MDGREIVASCGTDSGGSGALYPHCIKLVGSGTCGARPVVSVVGSILGYSGLSLPDSEPYDLFTAASNRA